MAAVENQMIEQLKSVGNRLMQAPTSTPDLLKLLDELEVLLSKIGQAPSQQVQEALLTSMKALIADDLLRNSDGDVRITVASCLNAITRISAPVAPYEDEKMKEIFELIVSSFDNLSRGPGRCYSKAVLILENVAKLRSGVMMLDLDCDELIVNMFELFLKNISPDHPHSVPLAMENIMSVMIEESDNDAVSLALLKVLLASIRKEKQNIAPTSWKLASKVIERCAEKLKPYIVPTVKSVGCCLEDYAPILSSICKNEPDTVKDLVDASAKPVISREPSAEKSHTAVYEQSSKPIERCSESAAAKADIGGFTDPRTESGSTASNRGKKSNSRNPDDGNENWSGKQKASLGSPRERSKKSSIAPKGGEKAKPGLEDGVSKGVIVFALEHEKLPQATRLDSSSKKKGRLLKKDGSGGSGSKGAIDQSRKDKSQGNDASKSQRKRTSSDDDVIETPHGRKNYREGLVGCRIKVWWPLDRRYYEGTITSFDASTRRHRVDYDDGDEENLNLQKERWEFLGEETVDVDLLADKRTPMPPSDLSQREGSTEDEKDASQKHTGEEELPDSGAKSGEESPQVTKVVEKSKTPEDASGIKKPRLSDGEES